MIEEKRNSEAGTGEIVFVPEDFVPDFSDWKKNRGKPRKYRGKKRSLTKGAGIKAAWRSGQGNRK
jgi:hypothetical protein